MTRPKAVRFESSRRKLQSNPIKRVLDKKHAKSSKKERPSQRMGVVETDGERQAARSQTAHVPIRDPLPSERGPEIRTSDDVGPHTLRQQNEHKEEEHRVEQQRVEQQRVKRQEEERQEENDNVDGDRWNENGEMGSSNAVTETDSETELNPATAMEKYYSTLESRMAFRVMLGGRRHFGYYAKDTDSPFPIGKALRAMEDRLMESLNIRASGSLVLDAGCGEGYVAMRLAQHGKIGLHCIDVVDRHVLKAERNIEKRKLEESITVGNMDYHGLGSVAEKAFDVIFTMESLNHARDLDDALGGLQRVLKPFGKLVLHEFVQSNRVRCSKDFRAAAEVFFAENHVAFVKEERLRSLLRRHRFESVRVDDISPHIMPLLRLFATIAAVRACLLRTCRLGRFFETWSSAPVLYEGVKMRYWKYVVVTAEKTAQANEYQYALPPAGANRQPTSTFQTRRWFSS